MENASKFLLMSASVLLGVMILALAVYLFSIFGNYSKEINDKRDQVILSDFNDKLLSFSSRSDITIHEIISLANFARENNTYYELESHVNGNYYLQIDIGTPINISKLEKKQQDDYNELLSNTEYEYNMAEGKVLPKVLYKCTISQDDITGRIWYMKFTSI